jgi:hypothetical protein
MVASTETTGQTARQAVSFARLSIEVGKVTGTNYASTAPSADENLRINPYFEPFGRPLFGSLNKNKRTE